MAAFRRFKITLSARDHQRVSLRCVMLDMLVWKFLC